MARLTLKERMEFDRLTDTTDRLVYAMLETFASSGHGDVGGCGVAEFHLAEFADAIDEDPAALLRRLERMAPLIDAVCVEHGGTVLFALAGAGRDDFAHLYKSRGFIGVPPNLPTVNARAFHV
jgi:hypothetical protein